MTPPPRETIDHIVGAAGRAPSVHNTQPWRFEVGRFEVGRPGVGVADGAVLDLWADRSRQLAVLDPDGRQLHLSCGAALEHARVSARALGVDVAVTLLPDPSRPDHLARLVLTLGGEASTDETELADAALRRSTHRSPFASHRVPEPLLEVLRLAVDAEGAGLRTVRKPDDLVALTVLLSHADEEEMRDPAYLDELAAWTDLPGQPQEGIPAVALDPHSGEGSSLTLRRFTQAEPVAPADPPPAEHPDVVVVVTSSDAALDWLLAGQALGALLLHAARHGVLAQPLGQVTDQRAYRLRLRQALGLAGIPQMALRLGYPEGIAARTGRRDVAEMLRPVSGEETR